MEAIRIRLEDAYRHSLDHTNVLGDLISPQIGRLSIDNLYPRSALLCSPAPMHPQAHFGGSRHVEYKAAEISAERSDR